MYVRDATPEDVSDIVAVHADAVEARGPMAYDSEQVAAWSARDDVIGPPLSDPDRHVVVHESRGDPSDGSTDRVVAFGDLDLATGEICGVYVHPTHARRGVGSAILDHLERRARDADHDETYLLASKNAIGFYEQRGYERQDVVTHELAGGVDIDCIRMSKPLTDEPL